MKRQIQLLFYELHRIFPRFKFWRICRALGIKPYKWQRDYALGIMERLQYPAGRATGKTTAVMLRLLMVYPGKPFDVEAILRADPDFDVTKRGRMWWYDGEYKRLAHTCARANIPVTLRINIFYLYDYHRTHSYYHYHIGQ